MNKKFSTLLAGVALLSAMSANAQTTPAQNVLPTANGAYSIGKLVEGANSGLFQLKDEASGKVLSMDEDGVLSLVASSSTSTWLSDFRISAIVISNIRPVPLFMKSNLGA